MPEKAVHSAMGSWGRSRMGGGSPPNSTTRASLGQVGASPPVVESRHDNVRRTVDTLQSRGLIAFTETQEPIPGGGKPITVYLVKWWPRSYPPSSRHVSLTAGRSWRSKPGPRPLPGCWRIRRRCSLSRNDGYQPMRPEWKPWEKRLDAIGRRPAGAGPGAVPVRGAQDSGSGG